MNEKKAPTVGLSPHAPDFPRPNPPVPHEPSILSRLHSPGFRLGLLLSLGLITTLSSPAQPAVPHRAVTDAGGGNLPGITGFELFRDGIYWWKSGGQINDVTQREGTLAVRSSLGIRPPISIQLAPADRYVGQGYGFSLDGAVRDDLFVYYAANGYLRRKPLASSFGDPLADSTRYMVERTLISPPRIELAPVAANGAVLLWRGDVWGSYAAGGEFFIQRPTGLSVFRSFSAPGGTVKRMEAIEVLQSNGSRLKDSLIVLTQDQRLYQFDLDPFNANPVLLARNVWDFSVRNESTRGGGGGGGVVITRNYTTAIYVAIGDLSSTRASGRLLRISARDRSSSVEYDTGNVNLQVRGVAVTPDRIFLTVTPLRCGGLFGCSYDTPNAQIVGRLAGANSDFIFGPYGTLADKLTAGGSLEGFNLRADRRWLYWITGNSVWRIPADAKPLERDFEVLGLEVVQTTQDFDNSTRLVANKPTVARVYARLSKDTTGVGRYAVNGLLTGYAGNVPLPGSPLSPVNNPTLTATGNLGILRSTLDNGYLFELPKEWIQRGRFRVEFTLNPGMGVPETGPNALGNNTLPSGDIEVVQTGSPCLVFVPIHTSAPNYDPRDPASGFGDILARAQSMLPIDHFRFALKGDRISRPVVKIKLSKFYIPYPAIDYEPFDVSGGFQDALDWLKVYSSFEKNPRECGDTHYVGTVHWMANTTAGGSTSLGLATRPDSGVAEDLVVKMEPPGAAGTINPWNEPRGGETLAHELGHNYTLRHIDQSMSPLACGGGRPLRAGPYPLDACTIGIVDAANLTTEIASRTTQYGFDARTYSVIGPTNAADLMSYRSSTWISKPSLDTLFDRIPGFQAAAARTLAGAVAALPDTVVLVAGTVDLVLETALLRPCHRLPSSTFDPEKVRASLNPPPVTHDWRLRWVDANGLAVGEYPLLWTVAEDGGKSRASFVQFIPTAPGAERLQILKGGVVLSEYQPSAGIPSVTLNEPRFDAANQRLSADWVGADPDQDPLTYTIQFSTDDGGSWETLQVGYPDLAFATNTRLLAGGDRCRLRVVVTDGFNASLAESAPFRLPRHAPDVVIAGLREGAILPFGTVPPVTAVGYDAEDGSLDPARLRWELTGVESRTGNGSALLLRDLSPGSYRLDVTGTDSDQETGRATLRFEVEPLAIPAAAAPVLDGDCGDAAYAGAPLIRLALSNGRFVNARMVHADGALHACASDLLFSNTGATPAQVGLLVDRRADPGRPGSPSELPGFFVDEFGIPSERYGAAPGIPEEGFIAVTSRGDASWSAELRIPDALLGGWNRQAPVAVVHAIPTDPVPLRAWPSGTDEAQPGSWAPTSLGTPAPRLNRPPIALAQGPAQPVLAGSATRVQLDGTGSSDPDGDPLTFAWTQTAGPSVALENPDGPTPSFIVDATSVGTELEFRLVVRDASLESAPTLARVAVLAASPSPEPEPGSGTSGEVLPSGDRTFTLLWPGSPGDRCQLQSSADLVQWESVGFVNADFLGRLRFTARADGAERFRFYRAVGAPLEPPDDPRGALTFGGVNGFVEISHRPALNAYPLTLAAWIQTSRNGAVVDGIASKYFDGSFNGYALFVYQGRLRAFYFGPSGSSVWGGGQGLDAGPIADGQWHHVAFVVDAAGGRLVVDGRTAIARPWVGAPGPATTTASLQIGRYHNYPNTFLGPIDEVGLWNVSRSNDELAQLAGRRVRADEAPQPLGFWHFDEREGLSTIDASGNGFTGLLRGDVTWIASEVPKPGASPGGR